MKKTGMAAITLSAALMGTAMLYGCGGGQNATTAAATTAAAAESAAAAETTAEAGTGEAGAAETEAETEAAETEAKVENELLVVSFGTSFNNSRNVTIGGIENALREHFPEFVVRRAFTADTIINILKERDGIEIDSVEEALDRAAADGVKNLVIQPTHLMSGFEYTDLKEMVEENRDRFESIALSEPLLTSDGDYEAVAKAITAATEQYVDGETAVVFMGHGTEAESNSTYAKMQEVLTAGGYEDYFVGTVEASPTVEDVLAAVDAAGKYKKVVLRPLMVVAGDHATNDMAGDEEDSWKSIFEKAGYEVTCVLEGLGQVYDIQSIYVDHAKAAVETLDGVIMDNPERTVDKELLVVSFGTSFNTSRNVTIGGIENALREHFPEYEVRRAFTADTIIDILSERDGIEIDSVDEALDRAAEDGVKTLVIQPTHLMSGFEYTDLAELVEEYKDRFEKVAISAPLLTDDADYEAVAKAIAAATAQYDDGETAIVFMGHGTEAESNSAYAKMQEVLAAGGCENYFVGTVEASPTVDDVLAAVDAAGKYKKVVLRPLMVVAGDHANNDMAGDEEDSWKSVFERAGYEVTCVLEGLGQVYDIQSIYVDHAKKAEESLK